MDFKEADEIISESETAKSPFKIIGRLAGKFAPVGGFSRNNRYYPESHWKTVLESAEVQRRLKGREMLGMIGHEDSKVGDNQIRAGLISHLVSCLEIREDQNGKPYLYGVLDILDTPAGKILKAMHEGGAGLYVSSRAAGKLMDTPGKPYKTVSPQFYLETWDVVARPGFLEAKPVFEQVAHENTNESITEEKKELKDIKASEVDNDFTFDRSMNPYDEEGQKKKAEKLHKALNAMSADESIEELKGQINQLAKILEKVVDDVYEQEEPKEETPEGAKEKEMEKKPEEAPQMQKQPIAPIKESLPKFIELMANSNISEKSFEEILDMIKGDLK